MVCYNRQYQDSDMCRFDAMRMVDEGIPVVLVSLDADFEPSEWLHEFIEQRQTKPTLVTEVTFDEDLDVLLEEMKNTLRQHSEHQSSRPRASSLN